MNEFSFPQQIHVPCNKEGGQNIESYTGHEIDIEEWSSKSGKVFQMDHGASVLERRSSRDLFFNHPHDSPLSFWISKFPNCLNEGKERDAENDNPRPSGRTITVLLERFIELIRKRESHPGNYCPDAYFKDCRPEFGHPLSVPISGEFGPPFSGARII